MSMTEMTYFFSTHSTVNIQMELAFPAREGEATALLFTGTTANLRITVLEGELMERMKEVSTLCATFI